MNRTLSSPLSLFAFLAGTFALVGPARAGTCERVAPDYPTVAMGVNRTEMPLDHVLMGMDGDPSTLVLRDGDTVVPLDAPREIEGGAPVSGFGPGWLVKPSQPLSPSTYYVVTARKRGGVGEEREVTTFRTGTEAHAPAVVPATLADPTFAIVYHRPEDVGGPTCIKGEVVSVGQVRAMGFRQHGTPIGNFWHVVRITTEAGRAVGSAVAFADVRGAEQAFAFDAPPLSPDERYCMTLETHGYGDATATSERQCAGVLTYDERGPRADASESATIDAQTTSTTTDTAPSSSADDGGCTVAAAGARGGVSGALAFGVGLAALGLGRRRRRA